MNVFKGGARGIGRIFLVGLLAVLPLVITIGIVIWVVEFLRGMFGPDTILGKGVAQIASPIVENDIVAYLLGWAIVIGLIFLLGAFFEMGAKKFIQARVDALVRKIPVMGGVYGTARQLVDMMDTKADTELKSMSTVFVNFGGDGGSAFLALMPTPEKFHLGGRDYHAILIPTAPVPFGGILLYAPVDSVKQADISVDAFMSVYVSMGVTGPQFLPISAGGVITPPSGEVATPTPKTDAEKE